MADDPQQTSKGSKGFLNRLKKTFGLRSQSKEAEKLRAKYSRFRILVIGRANAGKTTLLKRVCNTTEDPCIYDEDKNLVSHRLIVRSHSHHFFTNSSNRPRRCRLGDFCTTIRSDDWFRRCSAGSRMFIVHSSSRAIHNLSSMILVDSRRGARRNSRLWWISFNRGRSLRRLMIKSMSSGAIYYLPRCGSSDNVLRFCFDPDVCRPLFPLEEKFFNEQRAGNGKLLWDMQTRVRNWQNIVPVVAIFMKFDDLITQVFDRNKKHEENTKIALDTLKERFEQPLRGFKFPPHAYTWLEGKSF